MCLLGKQRLDGDSVPQILKQAVPLHLQSRPAKGHLRYCMFGTQEQFQQELPSEIILQ